MAWAGGGFSGARFRLRPLMRAALCGAAMLPAAAFAQAMPDTDNGRYTLAPVSDGVLRLDSRTGTMSVCNSKTIGWACYAMPDERAALDSEIGRLQKENGELRAQLAAREPSGKIDEALPQSDSLSKSDSLRKDSPRLAEKPHGESGRKLELTLPSDRDVERVMSFLERAWRRLVEMADRVQKDVSGKI